MGVGAMKDLNLILMDVHTHWCRGKLEHLKIETSLKGESYECVMGECVI